MQLLFEPACIACGKFYPRNELEEEFLGPSVVLVESDGNIKSYIPEADFRCI